MKSKNISTLPRKGFTLIELVVVIGILAVLLTIVLVAINPARQFKQANDTKRRSDVNAILNAVLLQQILPILVLIFVH
jgi:prepilin-type N-terminal cleavage/methylation domain-containing protein